MADLDPVSSVFLYTLSTPLFSDYTTKDRFIWIPNNTTIEYRAAGALGFPPGTCIIKNFSGLDDLNQTLRLETRILLLDPFDDEWKATVYIWNESQTEAIKQPDGQSIEIRVRKTSGDIVSTLYRIPNTTQCSRCHDNGGTILPIGPAARSLNFTPDGWNGNQLVEWSSQGKLSGLPANGVPVLPDWTDGINFSLDERARAYLNMNCSHCHNEDGDGGDTELWLTYEESDSMHLGFFKEPLTPGPGTGFLPYDIFPGDADQSIMPFRMDSDEFLILMPPIARSIIHEEGLDLIVEWINSFN